MAAELSLLPISSPRSDGVSVPAKPAARTTAACAAACQKSSPCARCSLQRAARHSCRHDAHDSIAAVLFLLLIVTASYAQVPWAPLVSYGLVGKCTQVARSPCCCSATVPTSSRAAQPTLVRSTSPCIYVCYRHSNRTTGKPPRSSSVLATHTPMCYMRFSCMCYAAVAVLNGTHAQAICAVQP